MTKPLFTLEWISRLEQFNQLYVGFSGGLDSTVLLHAINSVPSLKNKVCALHVNHQLSSNAYDWQNHCSEFCFNLGIAFRAQSVEFCRSANREDGARKARYQFFSSLLTEQDCLITAHHLDDQAETLLLQLFRGAGVQGLAAMAELGFLGKGRIARPFLSYPRTLLEDYARVHHVHWVEDESNGDVHYSRNYLRHQIMPLLNAKWPGVNGNLARTALHCQQAASNLEDLALSDCRLGLGPTKIQKLSKASLLGQGPTYMAFHQDLSMPPERLPDNTLNIKPLRSLSTPRIINVLRFWLKKNQIQLPSTLTLQRLMDEVIDASHDAQPLVQWADIKVGRYQDRLYIIKTDASTLPVSTQWSNFPSPLVIANDCVLQAKLHHQGLKIPKNAQLTINFRQGGEEFFWRGQNKQLKKLFQEWNIPPWIRGRIPLLCINGKLAAVVGYAISDLFFSAASEEAWQISIAGSHS